VSVSVLVLALVLVLPFVSLLPRIKFHNKTAYRLSF